MPPPTIHQLYCTHCTYGTSALHRNEGAIKDQVFEYSVRSGSVEQARSHQVFQSVEQYIKFQLPGDAPASEMLRLTAATCDWQRLTYFPTIAGQCMVALSCYRQMDTRGRPGSYFSHVLLWQPAAAETPPFTILDALKMWGAPFWASADGTQLPFDLPALGGVQMLPGYGTCINDEVLLAFLRNPPDDSWNAPPLAKARAVVPPRWRTKPCEERQTLLADLLGTVLGANAGRSDRLILAAEPSMAALLFYGVARLAPLRSLVDKLSFSTYQAHVENPVAMLSGVSFFAPAAADLLPEAYRGAALNTYNGKRGQLLRSSPAAERLVKTFVGGQAGAGQIDRLIALATEAGASQAKDLDDVLWADEQLPRWLGSDSGTASGALQFPSTSIARKSLQIALTREMAAWPADAPYWKRIAITPGHVPQLLALLSSAEGSDQAARLSERLCDLLRPADLRGVLGDSRVATERKVQMLLKQVREQRQWPEGCSDLWNSAPPAGVPGDLLPQMVVRLDADLVRPLAEQVLAGLPRESASVADDRWRTLVRLLLQRAERDASITKVLEHLFANPLFDDTRRLALLRDGELCAQLIARCPAAAAALVPCVLNLLQSLPSAKSFGAQLSMILAMAPALPREAREECQQWRGLRDELQCLGNLIDLAPPWYNVVGRRASQRAFVEAGERLAECARRLRSRGDFSGDRDGRMQARSIERIAAQVTAADWPADFGECLASAIRRDGWRPDVPAKNVRANGDPSSGPTVAWYRRRLAWATAVLLLIGVCGVAGWRLGGKRHFDKHWARMTRPSKRLVKSEPAIDNKLRRTSKPSGDEATSEIDTPGDEVADTSVSERGMREETVVEVVPIAVGVEIPTRDSQAADAPGKDATPDGPNTPESGKPNKDPVQGKTVAAVTTTPDASSGAPTNTTQPGNSPLPASRFKPPEYELDAHEQRVVIAQPTGFTIGVNDFKSPSDRGNCHFEGPMGVTDIRLHGPVISEAGISEAGWGLRIKPTPGGFTIGLMHSNSEEPILEISNQLAVRALPLTSDTRQNLAAIYLAMSVFELRYAESARYFVMRSPELVSLRPDANGMIGLQPKFCQEFHSDVHFLAIFKGTVLIAGERKPLFKNGWFRLTGRTDSDPIESRMQSYLQVVENPATGRPAHLRLTCPELVKCLDQKVRIEEQIAQLQSKKTTYVPESDGDYQKYKSYCEIVGIQAARIKPPKPARIEPADATQAQLDKNKADRNKWEEEWKKGMPELQARGRKKKNELVPEISRLLKELQNLQLTGTLGCVVAGAVDDHEQVSKGIVFKVSQIGGKSTVAASSTEPEELIRMNGGKSKSRE